MYSFINNDVYSFNFIVIKNLTSELKIKEKLNNFKKFHSFQMASSLKLLRAYGSDSESESTGSNDSANEDKIVHEYKPIDASLSLVSSIKVDAAPLVLYSVSDIF